MSPQLTRLAVPGEASTLQAPHHQTQHMQLLYRKDKNSLQKGSTNALGRCKSHLAHLHTMNADLRRPGTAGSAGPGQQDTRAVADVCVPFQPAPTRAAPEGTVPWLCASM